MICTARRPADHYFILLRQATCPFRNLSPPFFTYILFFQGVGKLWDRCFGQRCSPYVSSLQVSLKPLFPCWVMSLLVAAAQVCTALLFKNDSHDCECFSGGLLSRLLTLSAQTSNLTHAQKNKVGSARLPYVCAVTHVCIRRLLRNRLLIRWRSKVVGSTETWADLTHRGASIMVLSKNLNTILSWSHSRWCFLFCPSERALLRERGNIRTHTLV